MYPNIRSCVKNEKKIFDLLSLLQKRKAEWIYISHELAFFSLYTILLNIRIFKIQPTQNIEEHRSMSFSFNLM